LSSIHNNIEVGFHLKTGQRFICPGNVSQEEKIAQLPFLGRDSSVQVAFQGQRVLFLRKHFPARHISSKMPFQVRVFSAQESFPRKRTFPSNVSWAEIPLSRIPFKAREFSFTANISRPDIFLPRCPSKSKFSLARKASPGRGHFPVTFPGQRFFCPGYLSRSESSLSQEMFPGQKYFRPRYPSKSEVSLYRKHFSGSVCIAI
jgi:hypothetical protein